MTDTPTAEKSQELAEKMEKSFELMKQTVLEIARNEDFGKKTRFKLCISLISMLVTEVGLDFYPGFNRSNLHEMFGQIEGCIRDMNACDDDDEEEDDSEDERTKLSAFLVKIGENLANGKGKIKHCCN